jgi:hypothetical protein
MHLTYHYTERHTSEASTAKAEEAGAPKFRYLSPQEVFRRLAAEPAIEALLAGRQQPVDQSPLGGGP